MKKFFIKSISDLITNSSSEVFCYITSDTEETLKKFYDIIEEMFHYSNDSEYEPVAYYEDNTIQIWLPYSFGNCIPFFEEGIKALAEKNNCKVEFA